MRKLFAASLFLVVTSVLAYAQISPFDMSGERPAGAPPVAPRLRLPTQPAQPAPAPVPVVPQTIAPQPVPPPAPAQTQAPAPAAPPSAFPPPPPLHPGTGPAPAGHATCRPSCRVCSANR